MRSFATLFATLVIICALPAITGAQHLIWKAKPGDKKFTCLYGEIEVLATGPTIYYCGCNWWPGNPAVLRSQWFFRPQDGCPKDPQTGNSLPGEYGRLHSEQARPVPKRISIWPLQTARSLYFTPSNNAHLYKEANRFVSSP